MITHKCKIKGCANMIVTKPSRIKEGRGKFCSVKCAAIGKAILWQSK